MNIIPEFENNNLGVLNVFISRNLYKIGKKILITNKKNILTEKFISDNIIYCHECVMLA